MSNNKVQPLRPDTEKELRALVAQSIATAEYAASKTEETREAVRELAVTQGEIMAELTKISSVVGRWPSGPDDTGSGLAARVALASLAEKESRWPGTARQKKIGSVVGAITAILLVVWQVLEATGLAR